MWVLKQCINGFGRVFKWMFKDFKGVYMFYR